MFISLLLDKHPQVFCGPRALSWRWINQCCCLPARGSALGLAFATVAGPAWPRKQAGASLAHLKRGKGKLREGFEADTGCSSLSIQLQVARSRFVTLEKLGGAGTETWVTARR